MHILVPYNHPRRDLAALDAASHLAHAGDIITVLSCVVVPACYAVDVIPGAVWRQTCIANRALARARAYLESHVAGGVTVRILRVQARDERAAIVAGTLHGNADLILIGGWPVPFRGIAARFGTAGIVARHVTCGVQVVAGAKRPATVPETTSPVPAGDARSHTPTIPGEHTRDVHRA